jgi:hypothetical protein
MNKESYHNNFDRQSKTMLGHFLKSRSDYAAYYVYRTTKPPEPKRPMVVGSAVHALLLDGMDFEDIIAVYDERCFKKDGKSLNPKPAADFRDLNADKYIMKQQDARLVLDVVDAVAVHELGEVLAVAGNVFETPAEWDCPYSGLKCRMMPDLYCDMGDYILAYDLKTTEDIYPVGIKRTSKRFQYWLQDVHYSTGLNALFNKPVRFAFWFVEVPAPHRIARWEYPQAAKEVQLEVYEKLMTDLAKCHETGDWRDPWQVGSNMLEFGPWDVELPEEELEFSDGE